MPIETEEDIRHCPQYARVVDHVARLRRAKHIKEIDPDLFAATFVRDSTSIEDTGLQMHYAVTIDGKIQFKNDAADSFAPVHLYGGMKVPDLHLRNEFDGEVRIGNVFVHADLQSHLEQIGSEYDVAIHRGIIWVPEVDGNRTQIHFAPQVNLGRHPSFGQRTQMFVDGQLVGEQPDTDHPQPIYASAPTSGNRSYLGIEPSFVGSSRVSIVSEAVPKPRIPGPIGDLEEMLRGEAPPDARKTIEVYDLRVAALDRKDEGRGAIISPGVPYHDN